MRKLAHEDQGFVLVTAIILLAVMLGFGVAVVAYTNSQQKASSHEQYNEAAFNLAEAALNAQIGLLSHKWPSTKEAEVNKEVLPTCTSSTTASNTNICPEPEILAKAYPNTGPTCSGTEAWGSPLTNKWDTYVRANTGEKSKSTYFNSTEEKKANPYAPTTEKLWVRAVGVVDCHSVAVVSLISEQTQRITFPEEAFSANWFADSNNGNKIIINRQGKSSQAGKTHVRCSGFTGTKQEIKEKCEKFREGQISPEFEENTSGTGTTLTTAQLEELKSQAEAEGHFYSASKCPGAIEEVSGKPAYVEGCEMKFTGNGEANTETKPGFLVLASGSLEVSGNTTFNGVIYAANLKNSSEAVVNIHGNGHVVGEVIVDGNGGIEFGSSKENLEYSGAAAQNFEAIIAAAATRNSFRILPSGQ
jgi:Tfp pilus assembly protein PilX